MKNLIVMIIFSLAVFLLNCDSNLTSDDHRTGTLVVRLTDAPANYDAVNLTFSEISAHIDNDWVKISDTAMTVNLLDWTNGRALIIGSADIPVGRYTQIRLLITRAEIVVAKQIHPLVLPSDAQTGLKLTHAFEIVAGATYAMMLDFDLQRAVVTTGPPKAPTGYKLKPTIRIIAQAVTGSISGNVANSEHVPIAYALSGNDTVTTSAIEKSTGGFRLAFLPANLYTVTIADTLGQKFSQENVAVQVGQDHPLGQITLK